MPTQHTQQLNSTRLLFPKIPFSPLTLVSMEKSGTIHKSHNTSLPVGRRADRGPRLPRENLEKQLEPSAGLTEEHEDKVQLNKYHSFLTTGGRGPVLNPRDPKGSPDVTVGERAEEQTVEQMGKQKNPKTQLWTPCFRNQQECGRDGNRHKKPPRGVHGPADSWRLSLTDERDAEAGNKSTEE